MYKSKEDQREANRIANKRYRDKLKGITPKEDIVIPNVIPSKENVIPNKGTKIYTDDRGYNYKLLSDGQRWYYELFGGYHPEGCTCGIQHATR